MPVTPLLASDPDRIADHVLTGRLGSSGMGTVYLALDPDGRQVALKVVRPDPRFLARFRSAVTRARATARRPRPGGPAADLNPPQGEPGLTGQPETWSRREANPA